MAADGAWAAGGSLDSRFFADDGIWRGAPLLTGQGSFEPLPDVRNIMVTGGEGFIASWLVRHLVTKYPDAYNVVCFDKLDYCSSLNNSRMLAHLPNFQFFHGELTKPGDVLRCLRKYKIDTVFHLAAQSHVDLSFGNSYAFTMNNVYGTHVLLESANEVGTIKRFYHISTDEVYGGAAADAADLAEHSVLAPTNPYSASKAAAEMYVTAYVHSFRLPVVMIRLNNVYGPHQFPEKIIPKFISLLQRGRPLYIHGDGHNTRHYLYAGDAADAFDTILHKGQIGQVYNVDSRKEISNLELAEQLLSTFGVSDTKRMIQYTKDRPFNDLRYPVDGSKLRHLGWEQKVSFEDGLKACVDWYGEYSGWWGDIESILTPFPLVHKEEDKRQESQSGACSRQADVGAEDGEGHGRGKLYDPTANGVKAATKGAAQKRKAEVLEDK